MLCVPSEDEPLALVPGSESALDITDAQEELLFSVKDFLANRKENWAQVARWKSVLRPNYGREYANFSIDHVLDIAETEVGIISSASKLLCAFTSRSLDCTYLRNFIGGFVAMGHVAGCWRREINGIGVITLRRHPGRFLPTATGHVLCC